MRLQNPAEGQRLRAPVRDRKHIDTEGILQPCLFIEKLFNIRRIRSLAEVQHDPDPFLGGLV